MKNLCLLSLLVFGIILPLRAQTPDLEKINTDAYLSMMDADNLLKEKKAAEALTFYQKSLEDYESIQRQDPTFKKSIVDYRIDLLSKKIAELIQELPDAQTVSPSLSDADLTA